LPILVSVLYGMILTLQLGLLTKKWSDEESLYTYWLTNHPSSKLTFVALTQHYMNTNELQIADNLMNTASQYELYSNDLDFQLMHYSNKCMIRGKTNSLLEKIQALSKRTDAYTTNSLSNFKTMIANILNNNCIPADINIIHKIVTSIVVNAPQNKSPRWKADAQLYQSYIYLHSNEKEQALKLALDSYKTAKSDDALIKILQLNMLLLQYDELLKWKKIAIQYNKHHNNVELSKLINQIRK